MGLSGLEPQTSRLSGVRSNQLSYKPVSYTHLLQVSIRQSITYGREPGELKHLSSRRKRKKKIGRASCRERVYVLV